ncbi:MAG: hypothetical protein IJV85_00710 [Clostridia bacterium]|nr:hypothetical protein [Clostridia bacterium]
MIPLNSILATNGVEYIPLLIFLLTALISVAAVIIGCIKGFRRVSWGGLTWLIGCLAFISVNRTLRDYNPVLLLPSVQMMKKDVQELISSAVIMLITLLTVLSIRGILSYIFRPSLRYVKTKFYKQYDLDEDDDFPYDTNRKDEIDDDRDIIETDYLTYKVPVRNYDEPNVVGRALGGLLCFANTLSIIFGVVAGGLLILNLTGLSKGALAGMFAVPLTKEMMRWTLAYAMDFFIIGFISWVACKGFRNGILESLRSLLVTLGGMALIGVCMYLPFSSWAVPGGGLEFVYNLWYACSKITGNSDPMIAGIIGKLIAGAIYSVVAVILIILMNWGLKKLVALVGNIAPIRLIDSVIATILYALMAIVICMGFMMVLYVVHYVGGFEIADMVSNDSFIARGAMLFYEHLFAPIFAG